MAMNKEPVGQCNVDRSVLALLGLVLSIGGVLYWEPLLTLLSKSFDKMPVLLPVYTYLFLLNPLNFYLNVLLLLLLHGTGDAGAPGTSPLVFLKKHLCRATCTVCFTTLVISAPLAMHAAVSEESIGLGTGAVLVCLALVTILTSFLKKCLVRKGFAPALLVLCISTGYLTSFDTLLSFSNQRKYNCHGRNNLIHLPLLFVSFVTFSVSVVLVILRTGEPADKQHAKIEGENLVITVLSGATGTMLVGWYMELVYVAVTDMAIFFVEG